MVTNIHHAYVSIKQLINCSNKLNATILCYLKVNRYQYNLTVLNQKNLSFLRNQTKYDQIIFLNFN